MRDLYNSPQCCLDPCGIRPTSAIFRGTVLRPAWCPDCIGQTAKSGSDSKAPTQFFNVTAWKAHMDKHVYKLRPGPHKCLHPRGAYLPGYGLIAEYIAHRFDVYLIPVPDGAVNGTARWTNASNNEPVDDGANALQHASSTPVAYSLPSQALSVKLFRRV